MDDLPASHPMKCDRCGYDGHGRVRPTGGLPYALGWVGVALKMSGVVGALLVDLRLLALLLPGLTALLIGSLLRIPRVEYVRCVATQDLDRGQKEE